MFGAPHQQLTKSSTSPAGRADRAPAPGFPVAGPAARVATTTLIMTREKDISLHMKDGYV